MFYFIKKFQNAIKMALIKKSRLILIICVVTILFFTIQFILKSNLNDRLNDTTRRLFLQDESNLLLNKLSINNASRRITRNKQKISQVRIPLDENNQPSVENQLPFFNRLNHIYNFSLYYIEEPNETPSRDETKFVGIESENRIIDRTLIKKYDVDLAIDLQNVKGINKNKLFLYKPDSNGYFKCLNSNVNIKFNLK